MVEIKFEIKFEFRRLPLNSDLPFPLEVHPFCPNMTAEWLEEEGQNPSEWTVYKGVAFKGNSILVPGVYKGKLVLHSDSTRRTSFSKERIDEMTDLKTVEQHFVENGYILDHACGHNHARTNFIGYTLDNNWRSRMEWDAAASQSRQDWWEMLPPWITQPVIDNWLTKAQKEVENRIKSLSRWQSEAEEFVKKFGGEIVSKPDSFLSGFGLNIPYVCVSHPDLPFEMGGREAEKYVKK